MIRNFNILFIILALGFTSCLFSAELPELISNDYEDFSWVITSDYETETRDTTTASLESYKFKFNSNVASKWLSKNQDVGITQKHLFIRDNLNVYLTSKQAIGMHQNPGVLYRGCLKIDHNSRIYYNQDDIIECKKVINSNISIGDFSLFAGNGLALGCYRYGWQPEEGCGGSTVGLLVDTHTPDIVFVNRNPSRYGFNGVALQVGKMVYYSKEIWNYAKPDITIFLSSQDRQAQIEDNKIKLLYVSRTADENRETVKETIGGFVVHNYINDIDIGCVSYWQKYDRAFMDSDLNKVSHNSSFFGKYKRGEWSVSGEMSLSQTRPSIAAEISHYVQGFSQSIGFYRITEDKPFTYSKTSQVLGQKKAVDEIDYGIHQDILRHFYVEGQIAFAQNIDPVLEQTWRDREILGLYWDDNSSSATLNWYRFRKNVIADYDSIGQDWINVQNRFILTYSREVASHLTTSLKCQYQHYNDVAYTKNGFMQEYGLNYSAKRFKASTKLKLWSNLKDSYQESIDESDTEYLRVSGSDAALGINLKYKLNNYLSVSCSAYRPFNHPESQTWYLTLKADNN